MVREKRRMRANPIRRSQKAALPSPAVGGLTESAVRGGPSRVAFTGSPAFSFRHFVQRTVIMARPATAIAPLKYWLPPMPKISPGWSRNKSVKIRRNPYQKMKWAVTMPSRAGHRRRASRRMGMSARFFSAS